MTSAVNSPGEVDRPDPHVGPTSNEQPNAPYLEAVVAYAFRAPARYHVPGHKGGPGADPGLRKAIGVDALAADVPQDIHGIDLGPSPTPYERAEGLAAAAYGAERSWFLTNGATQGNHVLCLALAPLGGRVVAQRNSHTSIVDGLVLSGGIPSFVAPEYDPELGITHAVTPDALRAALREAPDARAAFVVSPTYYGMAADVAGLAEVAHGAGVPLVVDQSWGPHFGFHESLPPSAIAQGADAMVTSTHKIAGSLTQSAMLHVAGGRIDMGAVARAVRLLRSTSPSSLLLASLDSARRQLVLHGEQLLHETLEAIAVARAKLETIPGIALVDSSLVGRMGIAGYDPLRIVVDVRGTGRTGYEIADALRRSYDVPLELPTQATLVFIVGLGESDAALRRLAGDIEETVKRIARPGTTAAIVGPMATWRNEVAVAPRDAFLGASEVVPSRRRSAGSRARRSRPIRPACRRCCRASGSRPRRSTTCASSRPAARGCTARATRSSGRSRSWRTSRDRPGRALAEVRREARLRGVADVRRRCLYAGSGRALRLRCRDRRRADGRPRLGSSRPPLRPAGDPGGLLPARAASGGRDRRVRRAADRRLRRRARPARRPAPLARGDRGDGGGGSRRRSAAGRPRRRPRDHGAFSASVRRRPRTGRD